MIYFKSALNNGQKQVCYLRLFVGLALRHRRKHGLAVVITRSEANNFENNYDTGFLDVKRVRDMYHMILRSHCYLEEPCNENHNIAIKFVC